MSAALFDQREPAIHPRLREPSQREALAATWSGQGVVRIEDALTSGLAAELVPFISSLPHIAGASHDPRCVLWGSEFEMPDEIEPQYPLCLFALRRFLEVDLPALVGDVTGRRARRLEPGRARVWRLRRGCYLEPAEVSADDVTFVLGLNGPRWPKEWGGHIEVLLPGEASPRSLPPGSGTLDLFRGRFRIPLMTRSIEAVMLTGQLRCE